MASDEAASDDAASDEMTSAASDDAASDDVTSGPLVFRSTILQEQLTSGVLFLQEQLDFRSAFSSGASCLQERPSFKFLLIP